MGRSTLKDFLEASDHDRMALSFRQVEVLLGEELPTSLRTGGDWTTPSPDAAVVFQELAGAGFTLAEVDTFDCRIVLQRMSGLDAGGLEPATERPRHDEYGKLRRRHPAFGALKGVITVEPGYDLTQSLCDPEWLKETYGD